VRFARYLLIVLVCARASAAEPLLSFKDALGAMLDRSIDIGQQENAVEVTSARTLKDRLSLLPSLSFDASQGKRQMFGSSESYVRTYELNANINLFRFGADAAAMRAAAGEVDTQKLRVLEKTITAEQDAVKSLVDVIQNEQALNVLRRIVDIRTKLLGIANERFNRGLLARQEVDKISIDFDNSVARQRDAEIQTRQARAALLAQLGHDRVVTDWPWKAVFVAENGGAIGSRTPDLKNRPDWRAAERAREAAEARRSENWGKFLPSLDAEFSYGHQHDLIVNQGGKQWSGGIKLSIPLFDRLDRFGDYRAQIHTEKIAELEAERIRRNAASQWQAVDSTLRTAIDSARSRERTLRSSERLYEDNLLRFQQGRVSVNDLVLDQERLYDSELLAIRGWASVHVLLSDWCHAQGLRLPACGLPFL
jgi:outer membrane protein TolC